jgi:hypothetical protein
MWSVNWSIIRSKAVSCHVLSNQYIKNQTLANYRSSILDMLEDREANHAFWPLKPFFQAVQETTIRPDCSRPADIQAIVRHFHGLGPQSLHDIA